MTEGTMRTSGSAPPGQKPRITVGLPVFNGEDYLEETLDSLLAQDFDDFEIVISDNASTDRTAEICMRYLAQDRRIRYVRNERNIGGARNYSQLPLMADGEYFKWASADDLCAPDFLKTCVALLDANPQTVIAYPQTMMIDQDGHELGLQHAGLHLPWPDVSQRLRAFAANRQLCNPCFGVMRTATMLKTSLIRPYVSSDITFLAEMALAGEIHEVPEVLFLRRVTDTSCGLGQLSRTQLREWFNPDNRAGGNLPMLRVFIEIIRAIIVSDHPPVRKMSTLFSFTNAWVARRGRRRSRIAYTSARHAVATVLRINRRRIDRPADAVSKRYWRKTTI